MGLVLAVLLSLAAHGQELDADFEVWNAAAATVAVGSKPHAFQLWFDAHARRGGAGTTVILRPGVGLRLSKGFVLWAGYAFVPFFQDAGGRTDEHRSWLQGLGSVKFGEAISFQSRTRLEQRYRPDARGIAHRVRQFVRLAWMKPGAPIGLVVWDELFLGLNRVGWGPTAGYDQNRVFVGAALPIGKLARVEPGYLLAHQDRTPDKLVHAVSITLFVSR